MIAALVFFGCLLALLGVARKRRKRIERLPPPDKATLRTAYRFPQ